MPSSKPKPLISVIIPTYNRASYLAEAIDSVLGQDIGKYDMEIIVVDDGSTDDTSKIVKGFGAKVRYIKIDHSGLPAVVRNVGISKAQGELIAFQDSDDIWMKNKLFHQLSVFKDPEVVLCYSNAWIMKPDGEVTDQLVVDPVKQKSGYIFKDLLHENFIPALTTVVRKKTLNQVGGFSESNELRAIEDYELWLRISGLKVGKIKAVKKPLAFYRRHPHNISSASNTQALEKINTVYRQVWEYNNRLNRSYCLALGEAIITTQENWSRAKNTEDPYSHPVISVVMSVYNGAKYLRSAVQSILNQTFANFEFIIIDDGSTDESADIIRSFNDPRIRLIQQTNHGLVYSLNEGVRVARGQFIARMDADDISLPSRFERQLTVLNSSPRVGLVGTFFTYIDESNKASVTITSPTKHIDLKRSFYIVNSFGHSSIMFRKEAFEQAGGYRDDYGPTEDFELWRRLAESWELRQIPESLHLYRLSPGSISHKKRRIQHRYTAKIIREQWRKPFTSKSRLKIIEDAKYYRNMRSPFAYQIYHQYIHEQYLIAMEMLARGWFKRGTLTALAAIQLDRRLLRKLWRPIIGGFLRRIRLRPRKI